MRTLEQILAEISDILRQFRLLQVEFDTSLQHTPPFVRTLHYAAAYHKVDPELLLTRLRKRSVSDARFLAWWLLTELGWTTPQLTKEFRRDRGAITHGLRTLRDQFTLDPNYASNARDLLLKIQHETPS